MTAAEMDIVIGANVDEAINAFKKLGYTITETGGAADKTNKSFNETGKTSMQTRFAVQNLSNVFRDLPYAINNPAIAATALDHVMGSIQMLQAETGSLKGAFASLAGSLTGTGGLVLAFNIIGTAIALFTGRSKDATDSNEKHTKSVKQLNEAYVEAGKNFETVTKLVEISKLQTTTHEQQNTILKELIQTDSEYFNGLKVEGNTIAGLNAAYENYYNNILKVARAKGAEKATEALTGQLIDVKDKTLDVEKGFTNLNLTTKQLGAYLQGTTGTGFERMQQASKRVDDILNKMAPTMEDMVYLTSFTGLTEDQINRKLILRQQLKTQEAQIQAQIIANNQIIAQQEQGSVTATKDKVEKVTEEITPRLSKDHLLKGFPVDQIAVNFANDLTRTIDKTLDKNPLTVKPPEIKPFVGTAAELKEINSITQDVTATFNTLFNAIANGKGAFKAVEQAIKQLLIKMVSMVAEAAALSVILGVLMPVTAAKNPGIFAFKNLLSQLSGIKFNALGGVYTRPTLTLVGEQGPERITPLGYEGSASNAMAGEVVFNISGQNLRGVLMRANNTAYNTF